MIAYLAGYFDGEGCITTYLMGNNNVQLRVAVVSGDKEVLDALARLFGGKVSPRKPRGDSRIIIWTWYARDADAIYVLKILSPFMISKKDQAIAAMSVDWDRGGRRDWHEIQKLRLGVRNRLSKIKASRRVLV